MLVLLDKSVKLFTFPVQNLPLRAGAAAASELRERSVGA